MYIIYILKVYIPVSNVVSTCFNNISFYQSKIGKKDKHLPKEKTSQAEPVKALQEPGLWTSSAAPTLSASPGCPGAWGLSRGGGG